MWYFPIAYGQTSHPDVNEGGREVGNNDVESKGKWKEFIPGCKLVMNWEKEGSTEVGN
jgi:hypothetical protein